MSDGLHVLPVPFDKRNRWGVRKSGALRMSRIFGSKDEALQWACTSAARSGAPVVIHASDGTVLQRFWAASPPRYLVFGYGADDNDTAIRSFLGATDSLPAVVKPKACAVLEAIEVGSLRCWRAMLSHGSTSWGNWERVDTECYDGAEGGR